MKEPWDAWHGRFVMTASSSNVTRQNGLKDNAGRDVMMKHERRQWMFHESFISTTANNQTLVPKWAKNRHHETEGCAFICNYTENVCVE
jgi:hypothetical protein